MSMKKASKSISCRSICFIALLCLAGYNTSHFQQSFGAQNSGNVSSTKISSHQSASPLSSNYGKENDDMRADGKMSHDNGVKTIAISNYSTRRIHYHIVFSTECSEFQHWQSYLFFFSALKVKQPGSITRIMSQCQNEEYQIKVNTFFEKHIHSMSSEYYLHVTPDFTQVQHPKTGQNVSFKYFNKPFGVNHWIQANKHHWNNDDIIMLFDPDMIFLKPIVHYGHTSIMGRQNVRVDHGIPVAARYGYLDSWQRQEDMNLSSIVGHDSPSITYNYSQAAFNFPAGPPYMATVKDMTTIAFKWSSIVKKVHEQHPFLMAEMFAYSIAAAHLQLPHELVDELMVSSADVRDQDVVLDRVTDDQVCGDITSSFHNIPTVIHYCDMYSLGKDWLFQKGKVPETALFDCESPLMVEPPINFNWTGYVDKTPQIVKRHAFFICQITKSFNEAATLFKQHCISTSQQVNFTKALRLNA